MKIRTQTVRLVGGVALGGLGLAALSGCTDASPSEPASSSSAQGAVDVGDKAVVSSSRLSADSALKAAEAALKKCKADGFGSVSVSVVDRSGLLQAFVRGEDAAEHTIDASSKKAYTAAAFGNDTSELADRASGDGATIRDLPGTLFLAGGVVVKQAGAAIAGIGVGGAPTGAQDQACAASGRDALTSSAGS